MTEFEKYLKKQTEVLELIKKLNNELIDLTILSAKINDGSVRINGLVNQNLVSQEYIDTIYKTFSKNRSEIAEKE